MRKIFLISVLSFSFLISFACTKKESTALTLSGSVESKDVRISALVGGRLTELNFDEGDDVKKGDTIAKIDCRDYELQLRQNEAVILGAQANLKLIKKGARKEDIASASEVVKQANIAFEKAEKEYDRFKNLHSKGSITEKELDDIKVQLDSAASRLEQSRHLLEKLENGARTEEIDAVNSALKQAVAMKNILEKKIGDCNVVSPSDGVVLHRLGEPGEIVNPGGTIIVISDISTVRIRAFVPEKDLGHLKIGAQVSLFIDTFPGKSFKGKISAVSSEAEFTPKTIQTADERVKTVYEFKVTVNNKERVFKPGMPVDIVIEKE